MSDIAKYVERFVIENWERFFWILCGGWIQIYLANKKGVKFNRVTIVGTLLIAAFVGYWAGEIADYYELGKLSNFIASTSAIGSHSVLNFYSDNIEKIIKAVLKGKFKIDLSEETKKDNEENPQ